MRRVLGEEDLFEVHSAFLTEIESDDAAVGWESVCERAAARGLAPVKGLPASAEVEKHITMMPVPMPLYEAALKALARCLDYQPAGGRQAVAYQELCDDARCAMAACKATQIEDPATT